MIRFRNPGTQYTTQVQVFKELYKEYKDAQSFTLDDMARTIAKTNLMTAYGYAGDAALELSNTDNDSLNSTKMNAKMYAEVFRNLGWITSAGASSYPLVFTFIGAHVAAANDVLPIYEQCVLGMNNPNEIMDVKYDEELRFFKTALFAFIDLDGIMYKHELCLGPMSIDDVDEKQYTSMIKYIKSLRGKYENYVHAYEKLCADLGVKKTLPDNSTRLPIGFMKTCNWIEGVRTKELYPPKSLECLRITEHGRKVAESLRNLKDLRYDEYKTYPQIIKNALIRIGFYTMLERADYDLEPVRKQLDEDEKLCKDILKGKKLLFSPYQTLHHSVVDNALGVSRVVVSKSDSVHTAMKIERTETILTEVRAENGTGCICSGDEEVETFKQKVLQLQKKGYSNSQIVDRIFDEAVTATQTTFYPFIAMLFRTMGLECSASRAGDNGARWDAIIIDSKESIPIEIKSPTEESHISLKAIRQALENKVVLLSRKTHPTMEETTSLAVGYYLPNDRAEVTNLLTDVKKAYGIRIGVLDLKTILTLSVSVIVDGKHINISDINRLEGFANAIIK